jgi:hypothetical protein
MTQCPHRSIMAVEEALLSMQTNPTTGVSMNTTKTIPHNPTRTLRTSSLRIEEISTILLRITRMNLITEKRKNMGQKSSIRKMSVSP